MVVDGFISSDRRGLQGRRDREADAVELRLAVGGGRTVLLTSFVINQNI